MTRRAHPIATLALAAALLGCGDEGEPPPAAYDQAEVALDELPADDELAAEASQHPAARAAGGETAIAWGKTRRAELRELIPVGRTRQGAERHVVMRLPPGQIPDLQPGDVIRAAAELQVTTRCDVGQSAPGCGYSPNVSMQLVLSGNPDGADPDRPGTVALSAPKSFECTKDEHHCVKTIGFTQASRTVGADGPPCLADGSCYVNLVVWAYDRDARPGGADKLLIGANERNYLANGKVEQDRGRIMMLRERGVGPADKFLQATGDTVANGSITLASNGVDERLYAHPLAGGRDLRAGEKFRVWAAVDATTDHRVNLSLQMFLTRQRSDDDGGEVRGLEPAQISEHNGTNCSPSNPCHLEKVAVFEVDRDVAGPVFVNVTANAEVPGPGSARVTVRNSGYVKSVRYAR